MPGFLRRRAPINSLLSPSVRPRSKTATSKRPSVDERLPGFGERASLDYHPEVGLVAKEDLKAFRLFTGVRGR